MRVKVLLFGPEAKAAGAREVHVEVGGGGGRTTCGAVLGALGEACPALAGVGPRSRLAVNHVFARTDDPIGEGDEVALIGPVSGG